MFEIGFTTWGLISDQLVKGWELPEYESLGNYAEAEGTSQTG